MESNIELFEKQTKIYDILTEPEYNHIRELLIGGGAGGAKSFTGCFWLIIMCLTYEGLHAGIGRGTLTTLRKTTLISFFEVADALNIPRSKLKLTTDPDTKCPVIYFTETKSKIFLADLQHYPIADPEFTNLGGLLLTIGFIDEVPEITQKAYKIFKTRVGRWKNEEFGIKPILLSSCNPVRNWTYKYFYSRRKDGILPNNIDFVPVLAKENPYCNPDRILSLKNDEDGPEKQRLRFGNWEYDDTPGHLYEYKDILNAFNPKDNNSEDYAITCDVATTGKDKAIILVWKGWKVIDYWVKKKCEPDEIERQILRFSIKYGISLEHNTVVDQSGEGRGIPAHLKCHGFVGASSVIPTENDEKPNYANLRVQCFFDLADYIEELDLSEIKDPTFVNEIVEELNAMVEVDFDKEGKRKLIKKDDIKTDIGRSPDWGDTISMRVYVLLIKDKWEIFV